MLIFDGRCSTPLTIKYFETNIFLKIMLRYDQKIETIKKKNTVIDFHRVYGSFRAREQILKVIVSSWEL